MHEFVYGSTYQTWTHSRTFPAIVIRGLVIHTGKGEKRRFRSTRMAPTMKAVTEPAQRLYRAGAERARPLTGKGKRVAYEEKSGSRHATSMQEPEKD